MPTSTREKSSKATDRIAARPVKTHSPAAKASAAPSASTPVRAFMTASPHTIGHDQPLATAHEMMRRHGIRHLPVLDAGKLVGILSDRDLSFVETLSDVDPAKTPVSEAMSSEVLAVSPETPLAEVAKEMVRKKCGSAVVSEGGKVVGIFTTIDAMQALATLLASETAPPAR